MHVDPKASNQQLEWIGLWACKVEIAKVSTTLFIIKFTWKIIRTEHFKNKIHWHTHTTNETKNNAQKKDMMKLKLMNNNVQVGHKNSSKNVDVLKGTKNKTSKRNFGAPCICFGSDKYHKHSQRDKSDIHKLRKVLCTRKCVRENGFNHEWAGATMTVTCSKRWNGTVRTKRRTFATLFHSCLPAPSFPLPLFFLLFQQLISFYSRQHFVFSQMYCLPLAISSPCERHVNRQRSDSHINQIE